MKKNIFFSTIIIFTLFLFLTGCNSSNSSNSNTNNYNSNSSNNASKDKTETKELTESDKMILKISSLINNKEAFDAGNYIIGDIPAGEYAFVKFSSGGYYCEKDASGSIIDNENFNSFGYVKVHATGNLETRGVLISTSSFDKLGVSGAKEIYEILNEQSNYNQAGYYKVGVDIEQGKYIVESIGSSGYYAIKTGPVGNSNIVDNDSLSGKATINLRNGQYLDLSRARIIKAN